MRRPIAKSPSTPSADVDVDSIVARYTALGREARRHAKRRGRTRAVLVAGTAIVGTAVAGSLLVGGLPSLLLAGGALPDEGARTLRAWVSTELEKLGAARAELAAERDRYAERNAALERELAAFVERQAELERRQVALVQQSEELRTALSAIDVERAALVADAKTQDAESARELAAIAAERQALEERWAAFSSQDRELSSELARLEQQRHDLESVRAVMEQERRQLEALIEDTARAAGKTSLVADPALDPSLEPIFANVVEAPALGEMRGGVQLANGMNIAIGLTRSASINGVEQYSSSLRLDDLSAGIGAPALEGLGVNVIQNGPGNFVAPNVLDGLSSGFGTIIQNTLDNQEIQTLSTYDIAISDVGSAIRDIAAAQALSDSLLLNQ